MKHLTDQEFLKSEQYKSALNLNARIQVHRRFSTNKQGLYAWIFTYLNAPANSQILELGCGPGDFWIENMSSIPDDWEITLSDLSSGMVREAKINLSNCAHRMHYAACDAQKLPYRDDYFYAVIANFILFHAPDRSQAISEIHRVVKAGGRLFAATHGINHMRDLNVLIKAINDNANMSSAGALFGLENGSEQLKQNFSEVTLHRYEDALEVTEVQPLIDYVISYQQSVYTAEDLQWMEGIIQEQIKIKGAFHITKDSGMFIATKLS